MDEIKLYLQAVRKHLWFKNKDQQISTLEAEITNQLAGDYSGDKVRFVLESLGDPREVAHHLNYADKKLLVDGQSLGAVIKLIYAIFLVGIVVGLITSGSVIFEFDSFAQNLSVTWILSVIFKVTIDAINFTLFAIGALAVVHFIIQNELIGNKQQLQSIYSLVGERDKKAWKLSQLKPPKYAKAEYLGEVLVEIIFTVIFLIVLKIQPWPVEFNFFDYNFYNQLALLLVISIGVEVAVSSYRYYNGDGNLMYLCLEIFKQCYGVFIAAYILIDQQMFFIPGIVPVSLDNIFYMIVVLNIATAIVAIVKSLYKYLKFRS